MSRRVHPSRPCSTGLKRAACYLASLGLSVLGAEPPAEAPEERPPIFAQQRGPNENTASVRPPADNSARPRTRLTSPELAAKITSGIALPRAAGTGSASANPSLTPLALEDSGVVRLDRLVVRELRVPDFKDREILTAKGKAALARRRYPGAGSAALQFLEEDFANERRHEAAELSSLAELAGSPLPKDAKGLMKDAALRRGEFTPTFGNRR